MNKIGSIVLKSILTLLFSLSLIIIILGLFITNTLGDPDFYKTMTNDNNTGIKQIVADSLPNNIPLTIRENLGDDTENAVINVVTYCVGTNDDININFHDFDENVDPNITLIIKTIENNFTDNVEDIKNKLDPAHNIFSWIIILMIPFIIILLLTIIFYYLIENNLRNTFNWIGNLVVWPTLITLIPIIIVKFTLNDKLLNNMGPLPESMKLFLINLMSSLINTLLVILIIIFVIGLIIWIIHFFLQKKVDLNKNNSN